MKDWVKTGLGWAIWMFIMMTFIWPAIDGKEITLKSVIIGLVVWTLGGLVFGYAMRKKNKEKESV